MAVIKSLSDKSSSGDDGDDQQRSGDGKLTDDSDDEGSELQIVLSGQRYVRTEFEGTIWCFLDLFFHFFFLFCTYNCSIS